MSESLRYKQTVRQTNIQLLRTMYILLYKVVSFCLMLKIFITTEPIDYSISGKLHTVTEMVLGYFSTILNTGSRRDMEGQRK